MNCKICNEVISETDVCSYCGYRLVYSLDEQGEQVENARLQKLRSELLANIAEVGLIAYSTGKLDEGDVINQAPCLLLTKPVMDKIEWTEREFKFYKDRDASIDLYMKTATGNRVNFCATVTLPADLDKFQIGAKINSRMKLDIYYRKPNTPENYTLMASEIKLSDTIVL